MLSTLTAGPEREHRVQLNAQARSPPTADRETEHRVHLNATANGRRSRDHPAGQQASEDQHPGDWQPGNPLMCRDPPPHDRSPFLPQDVPATPFRGSCQQQRSYPPQV